MSEKPEIEIIIGGIGWDNDLSAFGDTIDTIHRMYKRMKIKNRDYKLQISYNVKRNAQSNYNSNGKNEWKSLIKDYVEFELIEPENKDNQRDNGHIILYHPKHIIEAKNLMVWWD